MSSQQITESCLSEFSKLENGLRYRQTSPQWLKSLKKEAIKHFSLQGFPTIRQEDWRYSTLSSLLNNRFSLPSFPSPILLNQIVKKFPQSLIDPTWPRLVFVNGHALPEWSQIPKNIPGLKFEFLTHSIRDRGSSSPDPEHLWANLTPWYSTLPLAALNTALFFNGASISISPHTKVPLPLHLIFFQSQDFEEKVMMLPRNQIHLEAHSEAQIVESHLGLISEEREMTINFVNALTQIKLDESARLDFIRHHDSLCPTHSISTAYHKLDRQSRLNSYSFVFDTVCSRDYSIIEHDGEGGESHLYGLSCLDHNYFSDQLTLVHHLKPQCLSEQFLKGIFGDSAQGFYSSKVMIHKQAHDSRSRQIHRNLLLSDSASVFAKPHGEINAPDAQCLQSANLGTFDKKALFFLQTRGIDERSSRSLLAEGFAQEILARPPIVPLRKILEKKLNLFLKNAFQENQK